MKRDILQLCVARSQGNLRHQPGVHGRSRCANGPVNTFDELSVPLNAVIDYRESVEQILSRLFTFFDHLFGLLEAAGSGKTVVDTKENINLSHVLQMEEQVCLLIQGRETGEVVKQCLSCLLCVD